MKRRPTKRTVADAFEMVRAVGLKLPDVEAATKYDGSPVLRVDGSFMAGLAMHPSAEPGTLVVRYGMEEREWLIEDAPETYYLTDYYRRYPLVLARLSRIKPDALCDLLSVSWRLTSAKAARLIPRPCRKLRRAFSLQRRPPPIIRAPRVAVGHIGFHSCDAALPFKAQIIVEDQRSSSRPGRRSRVVVASDLAVRGESCDDRA
jgi:hypothetical protein